VDSEICCPTTVSGVPKEVALGYDSNMCSITKKSGQVPGWQLSDDAIEHALADLDGDEARLAARRAELLAEAELRSLKDRTKASSTARWLRDRYHWSTQRAATCLKQAEALRAQPCVHRVLAAGQITTEQAVVIADTLDQVAQLPQVREVDLADAAALLVDQAGLLCPHDLQVVGRELVEHLTRTPSVDTSADADAVAREAEAAETAAQRAEQNRLTVKRLPDGSVSGRFRLCPVDAPILTGWLTRADTKHPGDDEFADDRDREQRRGDHLATTLRDALTATPEQRAAGAKSVQVKVVVTTSLEALQQRLTGVALLSTRGTVSAAELRRLACDAGVLPAVLGGDPAALDLGRTRRDFSPAQIKVLTIRDRGCIAPGCDRPPAECHAHHQWEWDLGGPTDLANGALLCAFHHLQIHRQGWAVTLAANGYPQLLPPPTIDPLQRPRQHHRFSLPERRTA